MTTEDCATCGHPGLRPEGHAWWCEPWNVAEHAGMSDEVRRPRHIVVCPDCGMRCGTASGLTSHRRGAKCGAPVSTS